MKGYARVWRRWWDQLEGLPHMDKLVALYLGSGPQTNRIGLYRLSLGMAAEHLADEHGPADPKAIAEAIHRLCDRYEWTFHEATRVVWIPSWWRWNAPESVKAMIGYAKDITEVPRGPWISLFANNMADIPETWRVPFREAIGKAIGKVMAYPDPEPEPEPEPEPKKEEAAHRTAPAAPTEPRGIEQDAFAEHGMGSEPDPVADRHVARRTALRRGVASGVVAEESTSGAGPGGLAWLPVESGRWWSPDADVAAEWRRLYPAVALEQAFRNMRGWLLANPTRTPTPRGMARFATAWLARDQRDAGRNGAGGKREGTEEWMRTNGTPWARSEPVDG